MSEYLGLMSQKEFEFNVVGHRRANFITISIYHCAKVNDV